MDNIFPLKDNTSLGYPITITVTEVYQCDNGWQHIAWQDIATYGVGISPIEYKIKVGDIMVLWFTSYGFGQLRYFKINK